MNTLRLSPGETLFDAAGNIVAQQSDGSAQVAFHTPHREFLSLLGGEITATEYVGRVAAHGDALRAYYNGGQLPEGALITTT